jgi:Flp pilus assembly protein TadG
MKRKSERAQSLVELAISLVILLYLLSGAAEFGVIFFQYVQLRDAAQEGALYGSMNATDHAGIINRVKYSSDKPIPLDVSGIITIGIFIDDNATTTADDIAYTDPNYATKDCEGHGLKVKVTYDHKIFMPFMPRLLGRTHIPLNAAVTDTILSPLDC